MAKKTKSRIESAIVSEETYAALSGIALARMKYRAKEDFARRSRKLPSIESAIVSEERYAELSRASVLKLQIEGERRERRRKLFKITLKAGAAALFVLAVLAVFWAITGHSAGAVFS